MPGQKNRGGGTNSRRFGWRCYTGKNTAQHRNNHQQCGEHGTHNVNPDSPCYRLYIFCQWHGMRADDAPAQHIDNIQHAQQKTGDDGSHKQIADRQCQLIRHNNQHNAGRNQNAQCTSAGNGTNGNGFTVALFEHGG